MAIKVYADAVSNLYNDIVKAKNLDVVIMNLHLRIEDKEYRVYDDIENVHEFSKDYFQAMADGKKIQTSLVSTGEYYDAFKKEIENGNKVICFTMAQGISGTYQSACIARDMINDETGKRNVEVIDSMTAGFGEGLQVIRACQLVKENKLSFEELVKDLEEFKHYVRSDFTVDDIRYLLKTGRVLKTLARFANFLKIKILLKRNENSKIAFAGNAKGRESAIRKLIDTVTENIDNSIDQVVYITHCDCKEDAESFANSLKEKGINNIEIYDYDIISGAHIGPKSLAVFYVAKEAY